MSISVSIDELLGVLDYTVISTKETLIEGNLNLQKIVIVSSVSLPKVSKLNSNGTYC